MEDMLENARRAQGNAYAPYSNFCVGVSVRTQNQNLYSGCNVENASYGLTQCAEANAIGSMITAGEDTITDILVVSQGPSPAFPCGACRQLINEFAAKDAKIHLCDETGYKQTVPLSRLLPFAFNKDYLK